MAIVLKVSRDDDIRRLTIRGQLTYDAMVKKIWDEWPDLAADVGYVLKYADDEGDLCTLAPATFDDFLFLLSEGMVGSAAVEGKRRVARLHLAPGSSGENKARQSDELPTAVGRTRVGRSPDGAPPGLSTGADSYSSVGGSSSSRLPPDLKQHGHAGGGGPWRIVKVVCSLKANDMLTPSMLASLIVQWLPMLTQRVTRKVEKINWIMKDGRLSVIAIHGLLEELAKQCEATEGLTEFAQQFHSSMSQSNGDTRLGETLCAFLKTLQVMPFDAQVTLIEKIYDWLVPFIEDVDNIFDPGNALDCAQAHENVRCRRCGANPITGPRFKCAVCDDFDLCGDCYVRKDDVHCKERSIGSDHSSHSFQCILFAEQPPNRWCNDGKGKGKMKGCKGWKASWVANMRGCNSESGEPFGSNEHLPGDAWACWWRPWDHGKSKGKGKWNTGKAVFDQWWEAPLQSCEDGSSLLAPSARLTEADAPLNLEAVEFEPSGLHDNEGKLKLLRDMRVGSEELNKELLLAHGGDHVKVIQLLTAE